jgi:DNA topoisomerase-2
MASLSKQYQKKTDKEHILDNPDTYIGSVELTNGPVYILKNNKIVMEDIQYNPALYKLFDEGIVNCRDHVIRTQMKKKTDPETEVVNMINIEIENNKITLTNNGEGIDVEMHPEYKIWIPEMIFGHLRTSTNYNKEEQKITGGKNGFGFKLVLIWSTWGQIETVDAKRGLKYVQTFEKNLDIIHPPVITNCKKKPYTTVSFIPDYKRLGLEGLTESMIQLFQRRVYDIAGVTSKDVKVKYNNELCSVKDFSHYVSLYTDKDTVSETHDNWSYFVCLNDEFKQVSFVNGIFTGKGGRHVDYIVSQIIKKMTAYILKKRKIEVKPSIIKEQLCIFLNSTIENPSFDSQTKDYLTTITTKFGSSCIVGDKFIEKLANMGVMSASCDISELKEKKQLKKTDGSKSKSIYGIPKLVDANFAGTNNSKLCTLILCEGDSAKSGIISGLSSEDRNIYGVYPMKGKLLNVRGESLKKINENKEVIEIKKILGLEVDKKYENVDGLRYGKVLFMTDQDLDGSHIKGLCINLFETGWSSLLEISGFLGFMNTPIIKAFKNKKEISFYNEQEYMEWKNSASTNGWDIQYYKGLGTSTGKEFKEYFKNKKIVEFNELSKHDAEQIDMMFNKKKTEFRKEILTNYDKDVKLDTSKERITYSDFIHKEMIHFSKYDCERSIPNMMDGLKTSQRKILYSAFLKNITHKIKVAQFSGYVSEKSGYHHGEASLNGAIVNMAQDYVGSNNINLLIPDGQFGSRLMGGKDSASERYIFTYLNTITRKIFIKDDDKILKYLDDDGYQVEPEFYIPIIPIILVNGANGIGTGFSTDVPCFNPKDIITFIKNTLTNKDNNDIDFIPYYKGFKGTITKENDVKFITKGVYKLNNKTKGKTTTYTLDVTELPIGTWTDDYKIYLEKLMEDGIVKDFNNYSTDTDVNFNIVLSKEMTEDDEIIKTFKIASTLSTNNMNLFDEHNKLTHYDSASDILLSFISVRINYYIKRKEVQLKNLSDEINILKNKYTYIQELLDETIDLRKKTSKQIGEMLSSKKYMMFDNSYNYLIKMTMDSVSNENVKELKEKYETKIEEIKLLESTNVKKIWLNELEDLEKVL